MQVYFVLCIAALPMLLLWTYLFAEFVFDDAFITYRYASNWASGRGLTWNPGEAPVEGFSSAASVAIAAALRGGGPRPRCR